MCTYYHDPHVNVYSLSDTCNASIPSYLYVLIPWWFGDYDGCKNHLDYKSLAGKGQSTKGISDVMRLFWFIGKLNNKCLPLGQHFQACQNDQG